MRSFPAITLLVWLLLVLAIAIPVDKANQALQLTDGRAGNLVFAVGAVFLLVGIAALLHRYLAAAFLAIALTLTIGIRAMHLGLVEFSGAGFSTEFFLHLEPESVTIALRDYGGLVYPLILLVLGTGLLAALLGALGHRMNRNSAVLIGMLGGLTVSVSGATSPEWTLLQSWRQWDRPPTVDMADIDPRLIDFWTASGLIKSDLLPMRKVTVQAKDRPINLIVVYMESVGLSLLDYPRWPGLMPEISNLQKEHGWVDYVYTSAFITIEGLANSMCGTLLPFDRGSDSLAGGNRQFSQLPCLGDILAAAGYEQVYLGGAQSSFAGKGPFLKAHGYGHVKGWEYWAEQGFLPRKDNWGLTDVELLQQATQEIRRLRSDGAPFNLTLLTIGTHLPGFPYTECDPYPISNDKFLNALHCTDQLLGRWVEKLENEGLLQDSLLVITSDHHIFPTPGMRALFGEAVDDRRLPLIIIGPNLPDAAVSHGASYDLAPTLLELLGVVHNAQFALGRSLVSNASRPNLQLTRYLDLLDGELISNNPARCTESGSDGVEPTLRLDSCGKMAFLDVLTSIAEQFAEPPARAVCAPARLTRVRVPQNPGDAAEFEVGGQDQSELFSWFGVPVKTSSPGLYVISLGTDGRLENTRHVPASEIAGLKDEPFPGAIRLIAWKPDLSATDDIDWPLSLSAFGLKQKASGAAIIGRSGEVLKGVSGEGELVLDLALCRSILPS